MKDNRGCVKGIIPDWCTANLHCRYYGGDWAVEQWYQVPLSFEWTNGTPDSELIYMQASLPWSDWYSFARLLIFSEKQYSVKSIPNIIYYLLWALQSLWGYTKTSLNTLKNLEYPGHWNSTSASFDDVESFKLSHLMMLPWLRNSKYFLCVSKYLSLKVRSSRG